jgi:hypothetical protein
MLRIAATALFLLFIQNQDVSAYSGCDKYRFGSQDWWFCMSDKDGER